MTRKKMRAAPRKLDEVRRVDRRGNGARMELRITRIAVRHPALARSNNANA